ncbi:semaphorin-1A-like isoform X1 [Macrosteles quadrilineatus]|uniref:semaphorin-1A-like isoform X1 n=1 Tax=Macrosteles quadrilineatus TaxID=74068 RepID=UPI0023E14AAF|nr:semaphorin-1A-like isoform X1 [Macrosteles quadrilineatus]
MSWMSPNLAWLQVLLSLHVTAWLQNAPPNIVFHQNEEPGWRFLGNESYTDHFTLLQKEHSSVLIGARNYMYNISLVNMTEFVHQRISWQPSGAHRELCFLKGKSEHDCHNYIRIGARTDEEHMIVCGTNAYKPQCRTYRLGPDGGALEHQKETEGQGFCPYDPTHNSTAVVADGQMYSATVADFSGLDALIFREPLRTERSDLKLLNDPNFVSSMVYDEYVLFFFREAAVEYMNCGKVVYSRVARVCRKDKGGPHQFGDRWTSFLKARLNCSVPGDYPFYFDEIQGASEVVRGQYGGEGAELVYGVFTTPVNSIGGSAVCAFSMRDMMRTFDGEFKEQATMNANWLRVSPSKVPEPRPGQCVNDSRTLPDVSVNFVKSHSLMDEAVPSFFSIPLLVRISSQYRFSSIAVDPQVMAVSGEVYDVMFVGTDDGRVLKAINIGQRGSEPAVRSVVVEELQLLRSSETVRRLSVVRVPGQEDRLLVVSDDAVVSVPLHRCGSGKITNCSDCIGLQDPYCAWDTRSRQCVAHGENNNKKHFLQNIPRGEHKACPAPTHVMSAMAPQPLDDKDIDEQCPQCSACNPSPCTNSIESNAIPNSEKIVIYSADTLGMAVATSVLATLVVGFVAGYLFSRHFRHESSYSNMPLHSHQQLNRLTDPNLNAESSSYLPPCANNKPAINLVLNVPPKNANGKNANSSTDNKPIQKVKKTYI